MRFIYFSSWEACMQVFKVAKVMAPSVIYIDEIEKVMVHFNTFYLACAICLRVNGPVSCASETV